MKRKVFTYKELLHLGLSRSNIKRELKNGTLKKVFHGVYTRELQITGDVVLGALEKVRPGALLDGKSVIELYQGKRLSLPLHARVPTKNLRKSAEDLVELRRSTRMKSHDVNGFRTVSLADAVATCLHDGSVSEHDLRMVVEREYRSENGIRRLKSELKNLETRPKILVRKFLNLCIAGTDSNLERRFVAELRKLGLETEQNFLIGGYKWDCALKKYRICFDIDSRMYHKNSDRNFIIDRWKTNEAQADGWIALRITDECLDNGLFGLKQFIKRIVEFRQKHPRASPRGQGAGPVWQWHNSLIGSF